MPSHGAVKERAAQAVPEEPKQPKVGAFHHMEITPSGNGGAIVQHFHEMEGGRGSVREHGAPLTFADHSSLSSHIKTKLDMPGRATGTVASPAEGEAKESDDL
jgi:hypothetical protein